MTWFDDILNGIWDAVFPDELGALQGIYDFIKEIPNNLILLLLSLLYIMMYPFIILVTFLHDIIGYFWTLTVNLFNIPLDLINTSYNLMSIVHMPIPPIQLWILFLILGARVLFIIIRWIWSLIP